MKLAAGESRIYTRDSKTGWIARAMARHAVPAGPAVARIMMRTYYFDMKDGVPTRDRNGLDFATSSGAIEHSKELARRLRRDPRITNRSLSIVVIDESGAAIHREPVHPAPIPTPPKFQRWKR